MQLRVFTRSVNLFGALGGIVALALVLLGPVALASPRKKHAPAVAAHGKARPPRPAPSPPPSPSPSRAPSAVTATRRSPPPSEKGEGDVGDSAPAADGGAVLAAGRAGDAAARGEASRAATAGSAGVKAAKTNVYTFGAMDVEGKLKTPQLLYFLNRVKLELEMSAPDQRSFMKELARTADDSNL